MIGYIGQQSTLFCGSVRDNIKVGKQNASDEEIKLALRQANLYDFVMEQEKKLDF